MVASSTCGSVVFAFPNLCLIFFSCIWSLPPYERGETCICCMVYFLVFWTFHLYTHVTHLCLIFLFHGFWKGTIVDTQTQFNGRNHISHLRDYIFPKEDTIFEGRQRDRLRVRLVRNFQYRCLSIVKIRVKVFKH